MDSRLTLAAELYDACTLGCDIGTDHALLPCYLLKSGKCREMILCDISEKALAHAREEVNRQHLESRAHLVLADGTDALQGRKCECISIMGMGGENARDILLGGKDALHGATLIVSVHTDQYLVRSAFMALSYRIEQERLCYERGRYYIVWRAVPGEMQLTPDEIAFGTPLLFAPSPMLADYLAFRLHVLEKKLEGLEKAGERQERE
ncbi:MAG: SAM-dependent methyltransferase, partial [Clostridia bacterium]|nr:SAM-dependent methyltransferase [Clostridia bacterium]